MKNGSQGGGGGRGGRLSDGGRGTRPRARGAATVGWVAQVEKAQASLRRQGRGRRVQAEKAQASLRRQGRGRKVRLELGTAGGVNVRIRGKAWGCGQVTSGSEVGGRAGLGKAASKSMVFWQKRQRSRGAEGRNREGGLSGQGQVQGQVCLPDVASGRARAEEVAAA